MFFVFRDSYVLCYIYIYIYEHYMSILHMAVSGYGTKVINVANLLPFPFLFFFPQSAGAVEYTDCTSAEG